jgi:hypothetical protein
LRLSAGCNLQRWRQHRGRKQLRLQIERDDAWECRRRATGSRSVHRRVPGPIARGCECAPLPLHPSQRTAVVQMGSGETVVASRGRQRPVVAAAAPPFFQPTGDVMLPMGSSDPRWPWPLLRASTVGTVFDTRTDPSPGRRRDARNRPLHVSRAPNRLLLATFWNIGRGLGRQQFLDRLRKESLGR